MSMRGNSLETHKEGEKKLSILSRKLNPENLRS